MQTHQESIEEKESSFFPKVCCEVVKFLMFGKYELVLALHLICTAVVLKIFSFIFLCCITSVYSCTAIFLMYLVVAGITFRFTKKKHLNEKVLPYNRAVLITGCDTGFGHLLAKQLDSQGFHVFASCLDPEGEGANELTNVCSKRLQVLGLDVRSDESVTKALELVKENIGTSEFWAVVNNAGILKGYSVELSSLDDFKENLEVNTFGPIRVTKAFLPLLRQSRGRVVNLTSSAGRMPIPHATPYWVSKYAFVGFNDCLRQELETWRIKVISVEPELFQTKMTNNDRLSQCFDSTIKNLDESVRADYGKKYLKDFRIYVEYNMRLSCSKLNKVVEALESAVSMEYPDAIYRPSRHRYFKFALYVYEILPHMLKDMIIKVILCVTGFPKPLEANTS